VRRYTAKRRFVSGVLLYTKSYSPPGGGEKIALSSNERITEFLDFAIQAEFAYVNKLNAAS